MSVHAGGRGPGHKCRETGNSFNPKSLFAAADKGFAFDFSDKTKLFQLSNGTTAVAATNDPIGFATDLSGNGNHAKQSTAGSRPLWTSTSAIADGTKLMTIPSIDLTFGTVVTVIACVKVSAAGNHAAYAHGTSTVGDFMLCSLSGNANKWEARGFGSVEYASTNSRGGLSSSFVVASALLDKSQATAAAQSACRINGELNGNSSKSGPSAPGNLANKVGTLFSGFFGNMTGEISRIIMINRTLTVAELFAAEYWAGQGGGLTLISEIPPDGPAYYNLINSDGQSLSCGVDGTPVISTSTRFNDKMFVGGIHNPTAQGSLVPLVESTATEGGGSEGETPVSGTAEMVHELGSFYPFIGVCTGFPSTTIAQLSKGTGLYTNFITAVTNGMRRSREQFQHFKVRGFTWMQGEADAGNLTYAAQLSTLRTDLDTDIKAITGQTESLWCLSYQLKRPDIGLQHLLASDTYANIRVAFPSYFLPVFSDNIHLANGAAYKVAGAYFGIAYKAIIIDGNTNWQPLRIQSAVRSGVNLDLTYNPVGSLVFDTTIVAAQTQNGFRLFQSDGTTGIAVTPTLVGPSTVRLTAASSIPAGAILRVGFIDPTAHGTEIIKTNLRDSQGDTLIFDGGGLNYPMHNWAVGEQRTIA